MRADHDARTYAIIGAAMEVHNVLGCGFLEKGYQLALANEFARRNIPFEREVQLLMTYKGDLLGCAYFADFLCYGDVLVELKAMRQTGPVEAAQVLNYLKLSGLDTALLLNFGSTSLGIERYSL